MIPALNVPIPQQNPEIEPPMVYVHKQPTWKYKYLCYDLRSGQAPDEEMLNELGSAGWELAGMFRWRKSLHLYFKRPG